jgi:NAD(P)-dependent dehydrogenase (short-subunit alcohol dehydrogenase family)
VGARFEQLIMAFHQRPIGSGVGAATTADEVVGTRDLSGQLAIVTGGYSGLGLETVRVLAGAGARVIVLARTPDRARHALKGIAGVEVEAFDLSDPESIHAFGTRFLAGGAPLSILVNNAGIMATPLARDARGNELQLSTNHLGHFQLTLCLWPALRRAAGARVVCVSSRAHRIAGVNFEDPNFRARHYDRWVAYGQSKTANSLFAVGIDQRGERDGIRAFSVNPGVVVGPLADRLTPEDFARFGLRDAASKTAGQGAATIVWCATSRALDGMGGLYCEDCDVANVEREVTHTRRGVRPWAVDPDSADLLWEFSQRAIGTEFMA